MHEEKKASIMNEALDRASNIIKDNMHIYNLLVDELRVERRLSVERIRQLMNL